MLFYALTLRASFLDQLLALPKKDGQLVKDKIKYLESKPTPDGKLTKKLHGCKGPVYRLRAGKYRVLYAIGDGFVHILGVDDRADVYRGDRLVVEAWVSEVPGP